jgi:hypothetical protein
MKKSIPTNQWFSFSWLAISIFLCMVFLPVWNVTTELEDIKYIFAFLVAATVAVVIKKTKVIDDPNRKKTELPVYFLVFCTYVVYSLCNWYFLSSPYYGTRSMVYLWFCFLSFLLGVVFLSGKERFTAFLYGVIACGVIASFYTFGEYFGIFRNLAPQKWPPPVTGLFAHKNAFAFFVLNSSIWTAYFTVSSKSMKRRPVFIVALFLQLFALFICDCRGVLLLTMAGFAAVFLPMLYKGGYLLTLKNRYALYGFVGLCAFAIVCLGDDFFWLRFAQLANLKDGGADARNALYSAEWKLFLAHPLTGCGIGNFIFENIPYWSEKFRQSVSAFFFAYNAESDFLETLTETGAIGSVFYCFFLFGAVFLGIRELKRSWTWEKYTVLVLVVLMLANGIYDTPIRRLPCGILLWVCCGYLWRNRMLADWQGILPKPMFLLKGLAGTMHCLLAVFFIRILLGDFFYMKSFTTVQNPDAQSGKQIQRALSVCPFHPDALFQAGFLGVRTGEFGYTKLVADRLEQTAPNYRPTDFLKGLCALGQNRPVEALDFANLEIAQNPNCTDAYELKMNALERLGRCRELSHLRDSLRIPLRDEKSFQLWNDTVSAKTLLAMFNRKTGKVRSYVGGKRLRQAFRRYLQNNQNEALKWYGQLHRISNIRCAAQSTQ